MSYKYFASMKHGGGFVYEFWDDDKSKAHSRLSAILRRKFPNDTVVRKGDKYFIGESLVGIVGITSDEERPDHGPLPLDNRR